MAILLGEVALFYTYLGSTPNRAAALEHERLRKAYHRLGNMDLKIAAIALTNSATLLTRNYSDFGQITELTTEDWSAM